MNHFQLLNDLHFNKDLIQNPATDLRDAGCTSWRYLIGEAFEKTEGGVSYDEVKAATPHSIIENDQAPFVQFEE